MQFLSKSQSIDEGNPYGKCEKMVLTDKGFWSIIDDEGLWGGVWAFFRFYPIPSYYRTGFSGIHIRRKPLCQRKNFPTC